MTIRQGIWLDHNLDINKLEFSVLDRIIKNPPEGTIESVVVGNEVLLFNRLDLETYISYFKKVKDLTDIPVVLADIYGIFLNPEIVKNILPFIDIVGVHIFPYWEGILIDGSVQDTIEKFRVVRDQFLDTDKKIEVYEMGWPSSGYGHKNSFPSSGNQVNYLKNVIDAFAPEGVFWVNAIEAFD